MIVRQKHHHLSLFLAISMLASTFIAKIARADFKTSGEQREFQSVSDVVESRFEESRGPSAFDKIALHRVSATDSDSKRPVVLYLPGTNMNGETPVDDAEHNLMLFLAANGVDTWALDYRTHFIPPDTEADQLEELKSWNDGLFLGDIDSAAQFVSSKSGRARIFIAGFSRGAAFAYLYAAQHPERVAGLIILDGFIGKPTAAGSISAALGHLTGRYATDIGGRNLTYDKRKALLELVIQDPNSPAPIPKYKTAGENLEHVVYDSASFGGHGGLANPQGGFSEPVTLAHYLLLYDRYWPAVQDEESALTPEVESRLRKSHVPVIAFSSTNIAETWPQMVHSSAQGTGGAVKFIELKGWGHLDVLAGTKAKTEVFEPVLGWIKQHQK